MEENGAKELAGSWNCALQFSIFSVCDYFEYIHYTYSRMLQDGQWVQYRRIAGKTDTRCRIFV
jgi:hypothetical protein